MNINKVDIMKWVTALRSGKYKQTRTCLNDEKGFCCLGVACDLFIDEADQLRYYDDYDEDNRCTSYLKGDLPCDQPNAPEWLQIINEDFEKKEGREISALNDGVTDWTATDKARKSGEIEANEHIFKRKPLSFAEIADKIEEHYL